MANPLSSNRNLHLGTLGSNPIRTHFETEQQRQREAREFPAVSDLLMAQAESIFAERPYNGTTTDEFAVQAIKRQGHLEVIAYLRSLNDRLHNKT